MTRIIHPKNWNDFQHYKDRSPTWIKLHKRLLDDFEFQGLPLASRALAPMLWLIASEHEDGEIDADEKKLAFRLRTTPKDLSDGLKPLIDSGFFEVVRDDSATLAEPERVASPEKRTSKTQETSKAEDSTALAIATYNLEASKNDWPEATQINAKRRTALKARLVECGGLDGWQEAMERASRSDFLTGRSPRSQGHENWVPDLDFFLQPASFTKLMEGKYDNHKSAERGGNVLGAIQHAASLMGASGNIFGNSNRTGEASTGLPEQLIEGRKRLAAS